jgi:hypothetical protein
MSAVGPAVPVNSESPIDAAWAEILLYEDSDQVWPPKGLAAFQASTGKAAR